MKLARIEQVLSLWNDVFRLLKRAAPGLSISVALVTLLEAVLGLSVLYFIKLLVDKISSGVSSQNYDMSPDILYLLIGTGIVIVVVAFAQAVASILKMRQGLKVSDYVDREIHGRAISVSLRYYESPEYYDTLERAREGGSKRPAQIVTNTVVMFRAAITILGILILIGTVEHRLIPILLVPISIALIIRLHFARRLFQWRMSRAQRERRASYLDFVMTKASHAKDLRINGLGSFFRDCYSELRTQLRKDEIQIEQARLWSEFAMASLGAVVFITVCTWLLYQSFDQSGAFGDIALILLLLRRAESSGKEFIGNVSKIVDDHLYLQRLFDFLSVPIQSASVEVPDELQNDHSPELIMSNVSFRYDGADSDVLTGVSLRVKPGQIVALVGENGSGKTTLIKLLSRLYDPTVGSITIGGTDICRIKPSEYRKLISVVFQDYAIYAETAADNIRFGDVEKEEERSEIYSAAENAGASSFIEKLPMKYDTALTKLFDNGHDLSIGQWQRIALARALYANSKILILDEPTSAMDPKAEADLFENFRTRIGRRSALIISHRLSTVRQADYIYVLSENNIAEHGTHTDLINLQGEYARLFEKQAKSYR